MNMAAPVPPPPPPAPATYVPPPSYAPPPPPASQAFGAPPVPPGGVIPNYLVQSILATLCCCLPLGVVAIIFSAQVNSKVAAGDFAGAREASNKAKLFCWISFGLGILGIVISILLNAAAILQNMGR